ncbi:stage 0 sporulation family protein [Flavobacterium chuncheonense]|uniref:Stage 0 sporulation family protein n=1 Tax=Flavobacterium chuncheonense TaxID=2026653 RepID=A0ABW5YPC8_9FLAO
MACNNCSTGTQDGVPKGCNNNGSCGTGSCNKLTVFDWLSNMSLPQGQEPFDCVEVRFKNGRKDFYRNTEKLTLSIGDIVATEASPGHDVGIVSLAGELVKIQMKKKNVDKDGELPKIYRKASQKDIDIWSDARNREEPVRMRAREIAISLNLEMKISDVEFQGDASKATFYYTANDRVDFRQLIKDFAREFSIRIEMKQVGFRQEAARLGGIGSCGRELCCSTWLTDFRSVNTSAARYQQLSLNPQKLAGQCGKLKCCLNYELDTYLDALKEFPDLDTKLYTEKGNANCQKVDIFKELMWFSYENQPAHWHVLSVAKVKEILALNKQHKKIAAIEDFAIEDTKEIEKNFQNAVGQDSLTRFDRPKSKSKSRSKNSRNQNSGKGQSQGKNTPTLEKNPNQVKNQNQDKPKNTDKNQNTKSNKPKKKRKPTNPKNAPKKD